MCKRDKKNLENLFLLFFLCYNLTRGTIWGKFFYFTLKLQLRFSNSCKNKLRVREIRMMNVYVNWNTIEFENCRWKIYLQNKINVICAKIYNSIRYFEIIFKFFVKLFQFILKKIQTFLKENFYNFSLNPLQSFLIPKCDWQFSFHRWSQVYYQSLSPTSVMHERADGGIKRFSIALKSSHSNKFKSWLEYYIKVRINKIARKVQK